MGESVRRSAGGSLHVMRETLPQWSTADHNRASDGVPGRVSTISSSPLNQPVISHGSHIKARQVKIRTRSNSSGKEKKESPKAEDSVPTSEEYIGKLAVKLKAVFSEKKEANWVD